MRDIELVSNLGEEHLLEVLDSTLSMGVWRVVMTASEHDGQRTRTFEYESGHWWEHGVTPANCVPGREGDGV